MVGERELQADPHALVAVSVDRVRRARVLEEPYRVSSKLPPVGPTVFVFPIASWYFTTTPLNNCSDVSPSKVDTRAVRQSGLPCQPVGVGGPVEERAVVVHAPFPELELVRIDQRSLGVDRLEEREMRDDEIGRLDPDVSSSGAARLMMSSMMSEA